MTTANKITVVRILMIPAFVTMAIYYGESIQRGQPLEWHFFPFGGHGYVDPGAPGYNAHAADLSWPLVVDFMERHLKWGDPGLVKFDTL